MVLGMFGCGTPALVQCRAEAVAFLPQDPRQLTAGDVVDLVSRLQECAPPAPLPFTDPGDAGL